ncbi:hypothetical protein APS67_000404 [Streptomyces sp. AVP053U2]|nr:hypothetical protein APS67_000404 [Streptomyces sp. AVP053U2]
MAPAPTGTSSAPPPGWCATACRSGALAAAGRTGARLDALADGDSAYLAGATAYAAEPTRRGGFGMCGRRDEYTPVGVTVPYGDG